MLNDDDPKTREVATELASVLIALVLDEALFAPETGALRRFVDSLARTTDSIDRCLARTVRLRWRAQSTSRSKLQRQRAILPVAAPPPQLSGLPHSFSLVPYSTRSSKR